MNCRALILGFAVMVVTTSAAWSQARKVDPDWQRQYAPTGMSVETRGSAVMVDGGLAVLGVQRPLVRVKDRSHDKGWIGLFSATGEVRRELVFVVRGGDAAVQEIDAFAPMSNGDFAVVGQALDGETVLLTVAQSGTTRLVRALGRSRVAFVLPLADGDFVLGGRDGRDLYAARLRPDGGIVWERRLDRGLDELFLAGVVVSDGVLMLEHAGVREQFFMRDAVVGLTLLSNGRDSIRSPSFTVQGRAGAFVAAGARGFGLVVDTGIGVKQSLKFVRLDGALKPTAEVDLLTVQFSLERARLARSGTSGFWLTALDGSRLVGLLLDDAGQIAGRFESPPGRVFLHPDAAAGDADYDYAVATELIEREGEQGVRTAVYIAKFTTARR